VLRLQVAPKYSTEVRATPVDFSALFYPQDGTDSFISSPAAVAVSVYSGVDPTPPAFYATYYTPTQQLIHESGGLPGVIYQVVVTGTSSPNNYQLVVTYLLAIIPAAP
jgi:hypothetical protein